VFVYVEVRDNIPYASKLTLREITQHPKLKEYLAVIIRLDVEEILDLVDIILIRLH
jgi:hypothetical protein